MSDALLKQILKSTRVVVDTVAFSGGVFFAVVFVKKFVTVRAVNLQDFTRSSFSVT